MIIFVTGTDTDVGKTLVSTWLCLHSNYKYFKPIQTGTAKDKDFVSNVIGIENTYKETFIYPQAVAPYLAAKLNNREININDIKLPNISNLIVEGAGGLMVPINDKILIIDLIKYLNLPVILVSRTTLGTINHTLLSIKLLEMYKINCLGIVLSGKPNIENKMAIEHYGKINILAELPYIENFTKSTLLNIPLPMDLKNLLHI